MPLDCPSRSCELQEKLIFKRMQEQVVLDKRRLRMKDAVKKAEFPPFCFFLLFIFTAEYGRRFRTGRTILPA